VQRLDTPLPPSVAANDAFWLLFSQAPVKHDDRKAFRSSSSRRVFIPTTTPNPDEVSKIEFDKMPRISQS
jgi:hypothetical protein